MKLESTKSKHPQLVYEAKLYKILQGAVGACRKWPAAAPRRVQRLKQRGNARA